MKGLGWTSSVALLIAYFAFGYSGARAIDFETLVMPGRVIRDHAEFESDCRKCHQAFDSDAETSLCLECHVEVGEDRRQSSGFHGRSPGAAETKCRACHSEHKGRDADVLGLEPETFNHEFTDFPLSGAHRDTACGECHVPVVEYREAAVDCASCHRADDAHEGRLGSDCASCHVDLGWQHANFDHDKTAFPLLGRHQDVACNVCHPREQYANTASDCNSCHRIGDQHRGRFGPRCETCHATEGWSSVTFDHARDTRFALDGAHADTACVACHPGTLYEESLETECYSCHRADDRHRGRNGTECHTCHTATSWSTSKFDHDRRTNFPLRGVHRSTPCESCHTGPLDQKTDTACVACHRGGDVHRGQQGTECAQCHNERGWGADVFFDHDLTSFPLLGLHAVVACEQCHLEATYKDAETTCLACHRLDDHHQRRLGTSCDACHTPNGWRFWRFDHVSQTRFPLQGAHEEVGCESCHRKAMKQDVVQSMKCFSCHAKDDSHYGSYGRDCSRCHDDSSWSEVQVGR